MAAITYTLAEAKKMFDQGLLRKFFVSRAVMHADCWVLSFNAPAAGLGGQAALVDARSGQQRVFKSLDAVLNTVEKVGFKVECLWPCSPGQLDKL